MPYDYSKTSIYKIVPIDKSLNLCYVGHTTNFISRQKHHKSCSKNKDCNNKLYLKIKECGGWDKFEMIQIEELNCNNIYEATLRERYWYDKLKANMNQRLPICYEGEKRKYNKKRKYNYKPSDKKKEYLKQYYQEHKEQMKESSKKWKINNPNKNYKHNPSDKKKILHQKCKNDKELLDVCNILLNMSTYQDIYDLVN